MCQFKGQCPDLPFDLISLSQDLGGNLRLMVPGAPPPAPILVTHGGQAVAAWVFPPALLIQHVQNHSPFSPMKQASCLASFQLQWHWRLEAESYPSHPSLTHGYLGSENNHRCPVEGLGHVRKVVDTADACLCDCMMNVFLENYSVFDHTAPYHTLLTNHQL